VNASAGKNLIGAFHQPILVLADVQTLCTLPDVEFVSGLAECIKHDVIRDTEGFSWFESNLDAILTRNPGVMTTFIAHNVEIKARVVMADPFERGERAHLNFGHTFGHAIETITNYTLPHGYAVALGMVAATRTAVRLNMLDEASARRIIALIERAGLPLKHGSLDVARTVDYMAFDKKVVDGKVRLILPDRIGHVVVRDDIPRDVITAALQTLVG
jgi:3-dehydroquinate synthase